MTNRFGFDFLGYGMGLRTPHYDHILENKPPVDWFEIISENYMDTDGKPKRILEQILETYPVVMHGVSMSIGTVDPLNSDYLKKLKELISWVNPPWISDHLCWTGVAHKNSHDLLPVPYTEQALAHIVDRIKQVQDFLGRPLLIENPSTYLEFSDSTMTEWDFIARMADQADCGLLLDVNNVYVSSFNHRLDPKTYLDALPLDRVAQIHMAGHMNRGNHLVDTHEGPIIDDVWTLYEYVISKAGEITTMIEWDTNIPDFDTVMAEVTRMKEVAQNATAPNNLPNFEQVRDVKTTSAPYEQRLNQMMDGILVQDPRTVKPEGWIVPKEDFPIKDQLGVYRTGYRIGLFDVVNEDFKTLRHYLGDRAMDKLIENYVQATPSRWYDISQYINDFPDFIKEREDQCAYEIAVLEMTISQLYHAEETSVLTQESLQGITPEALMEMSLLPRKALKLLEFDYAVNDYYQAIRDGKKERGPRHSKSWMVAYRHQDAMWRLGLSEGEYNLLQRLATGIALGEALEQTDDVDETDISQWFAKWMNNGLLAQGELAQGELDQ